MVGGGLSMAITSVTSWLTPTVLFIVLNLMIAIIFIASNFKPPHHDHQQHHQDSPSQLVRAPSLLQRVKSINFSSFYPPDSHEYNSVSQLTQPPTFLQRVRSIDLSFSSYYYTPPPVDQVTELDDSDQSRHDPPSQLTRVPSFLERVKSFKLASPFTSDQNTGDNFYTSPPVDQTQPSDSDQTRGDSVSQLTRVPSFLERVKSFRLASAFNNSGQHSGENTDLDRDPHRDPTQDDDVASEDSDVVTPATAEKPVAAAAAGKVMSKSRSARRMPESDDDDGESDEEVDRRRPATMKASIGGKEECVDAKADDFIKRFKQQLKLQRLESLQRFREMLNR